VGSEDWNSAVKPHKTTVGMEHPSLIGGQTATLQLRIHSRR